MEKRTLLALALSFVVLGFYPVILQKFYPDYYKKSPEKTASSPAAPGGQNAAPVGVAKLVNAGSFTPEEDLQLRDASMALTFNKKDGGIREIAFPRFTNSETSRPIQFISLKNTGVSTGSLLASSGAESGLVMDYAAQTADNRALFSANVFSGKLSVQKSYLLKGEYEAELGLRFENATDAALPLNYELVVGSGVAARHSIDAQYIEANFFSEDAEKRNLKHIRENKAGKQVSSAGPVKWVAVKDRHFSVIMKPVEGSFTGLVRGLGGQDFSASLLSSALSVPARSSLEQKFLVYIGPNEIERLEPLGLGDLVNFGKFDLIGKLMVGALEMLHKLCRNYGLAIILLTALINLILFPLTRVSYMSMKRMQLIQPQMTKLRDQHKKNPEKLNKEMMELYKKHKVNPFGGCLPMVLQIPIFIALYVALSKSVILINAQFLWAKDLSSPDRVYLPFSLPFLGNYIHLLPLLMCGAMVVQQKLTQIKMDGQDPATAAQQKMMAVMMPVIFGFIFYQMPSGLVIYWLTNTLLMLAYQLRLKNMTLA
jgi:YidC/Oxa1 family membrane protein insertase